MVHSTSTLLIANYGNNFEVVSGVSPTSAEQSAFPELHYPYRNTRHQFTFPVNHNTRYSIQALHNSSTGIGPDSINNSIEYRQPKMSIMLKKNNSTNSTNPTPSTNSSSPQHPPFPFHRLNCW